MIRKSLRGDERGVTIIEFALISFPMFTLLLGSIEFGVSMFTKAAIDGALKEAARMATTGDPTITGVNGAKIDALVRKKVKLVKGARVDITKQFYDKFDQVRKPEKKEGGPNAPYCFYDENNNRRWDLDPGQSGIGSADDILNYRVSVTYPMLFPLVTKMVTGKPTVTLSSEISLRNEPFAASIDTIVKKCCISGAPAYVVTC